MRTIPSIADMAKVPAGDRVVTLPTGSMVTIGTYLTSWRKLKALPPSKEVSNWEWYPVEAGHILRRLSEGVNDRINIRGKLRMDWRDNSAKWEATKRLRVQCTCRWCGSPLPSYQPQHARFCEESCRRAYST